MQTLYGWEVDQDIPLTKLERHLHTQINKSVALYLTNLVYLIEVCQYSMVDKAKRLAKFIQTDEDAKASTTIAANSIITFLRNDDQLNSFIKKEGIESYINEEVLKKIFAELSSKQRYKDYSALKKPNQEQDKEIIGYILKKVFPAVKDFEHHLDWPNYRQN